MPPPGDMGYAPRMNDMGDGVERGERGYRRKKFAAMAGAVAGNIYRTGQIAVTEIRETYAQSKARGLDGEFDGPGSMHIPGAFPGVAITSEISPEQMMMFPCYAKQHTKKEWNQPSAYESETGNLQDEDYWRSEWERHQDERAIVDVDVRGWVYSPHSGPMTRRNRILIGLARQLSGIPVPRADQNQGPTPPTPQDEWREQEKIAQEAARIEQQGREEKRMANIGAYSEPPREDTGLSGSVYPPPPPRPPPRRDSRTPDSLSGSPRPPTRQNSALATELTEAELDTANANLMARIAPFLTNPLVSLPITIFFYNESQSQSRNVLTDDSGHFAIRAPLEFVPTHIKVLVNEGLSTTQEVKYIEPYGVSLISDIDDTVKMSNISAGAKEIFRNTFVRELADLTIEGVKEWYGKLKALGVSVHYCSNSPWQLFPMLATFFKISGLPIDSLHLKQYSGMLQGIFEPVAERKKNTLVRLLRDFPQRKFLLVGDSGEADLEVYTELALAYPGRILAVFIRDVTTPEAAAYFEPSFDMTRRTMSGLTVNNNAPNGRQAVRQNSSPGPVHAVKAPPAGPVMGTLIDFSDEPEEVKLDDAAALEQVKSSRRPGPSASAADLLARKPLPPPRPAKPAALASAPSIPTVRKGSVGLGISGVTGSEPPPPLPRRPVGQNQSAHPLSQIQNSSQQTVQSPREENNRPPPPPPPPRRSARNLSPKVIPFGRGPSSNSDVDFDPLPPSLGPVPVASATGLSSFYRPSSRSGNTSPSASPTMAPVNKKLELWKRRLARAQDQLDQLGVALYTWRIGQDVEAEAVGIIKRYMAEMEKEKARR
ncbi:ATP-dependent RNA helicase DDX27 [Trichoderma asperellum]